MPKNATLAGVMKKITPSLNILAAIIALTILQACARTPDTQCAMPTLTPPDGRGQAGSPITVTIATTTAGASLRWTDDGNTPTGGPTGKGNSISGPSGPAPTVFGRTLRAIAWQDGLKDSPVATGEYQATTQ
jgi:hypothetical protein